MSSLKLWHHKYYLNGAHINSVRYMCGPELLKKYFKRLRMSF